jgi:hypothetical protein
MKVTLRVLVVAVTLCLAVMADLGADEPTPIRTLLDAASSHNTHTITTQGIVKEMKGFPPVVTKLCRAVYDSYTFTLEDESGSIAVEVFGACGASGEIAQPSNGQRVLVTGTFLVGSSRNERIPIIYTNATSVMPLSP